MSERDKVSISFTRDSGDEMYFGYESAKVDCPRCEQAGGWNGKDSGLGCPYGCDVRVFSVQAEENERWKREVAARDAVRRDERAVRKARKERERALREP